MRLVRLGTKLWLLAVFIMMPFVVQARDMGARPQAESDAYRGITFDELIAAYSESYIRAGFKPGKIERAKDGGAMANVYFNFNKTVGLSTFNASVLYAFYSDTGSECSPCKVIHVLVSTPDRQRGVTGHSDFLAVVRESEIQARQELAIKLKRNSM